MRILSYDDLNYVLQSNLCIYVAFHTVSIINEYDYSIKGMQCQGTTFLKMNKDILTKTKYNYSVSNSMNQDILTKKKKKMQLSGF